MTTRQKGPDEVFCRSCGDPIKKQAEICPHCGVRNQAQSSPNQSGGSPARTHDPSNYETTVSDSWWYGIAIGLGLWLLLFITGDFVSGAAEAALGLIALTAWALVPVSVYFDAQYVRANSRWNPSTALYVIGTLIPLINLVFAAVYLYRRHETVGEP